MIIQRKAKRGICAILGLSVFLLFQTAHAKVKEDCERFDDERSLLIERYYTKAPKDLIAIMLVKLKIDNSNRYKGTNKYVRALKGELKVIKMTDTDFLPLNQIQQYILDKNIDLIESEIACYKK